MIRRILTLGCLTLTVLVLSAATRAQCNGWRMSSGQAQPIAQGKKAQIYLSAIKPKKGSTTDYKATAEYVDTTGVSSNFGEGKAEAAITGKDFHMKISWSNKEVGIYDGKIAPNGRMNGTVYSVSSPNTKVSWSARGLLECSSGRPRS